MLERNLTVASVEKRDDKYGIWPEMSTPFSLPSSYCAMAARGRAANRVIANIFFIVFCFFLCLMLVLSRGFRRLVIRIAGIG